jgi:predicted nucleic acid-binding protein
MGLAWMAPSTAQTRTAVAIARETDITVYDAVYVALAQVLQAEMVTADARMARRVAGYSFVRLLSHDAGDRIGIV